MPDPATEGELIRLRNRIAALEANGAELLARAEKAEAERDVLKAAAQAALDRPHAARTVRMLCAALAASESHADAPAPGHLFGGGR